MLAYYYIIIIVLIFLKIMIWTFYFYFRGQRLREARYNRRFIVVDTRTGDPSLGNTGYTDRSAIVNFEEAPVGISRVVPDVSMAPPSYTEAAAKGPDNQDTKPPSYDQAVNITPITNQTMPSVPH